LVIASAQSERVGISPDALVIPPDIGIRGLMQTAWWKALHFGLFIPFCGML
jgi:hypothetical protein